VTTGQGFSMAEKQPKIRKLTPKQERFVQEYLIDLNATQAAIRAGYSKRSAMELAYQLLHKTSVQAAIQKALDERSQRTQSDADFVLTNLKKMYDRCSQEVPVLDRQGNPTGEFRFDSYGALKALELLGKHLKMFTDKIQHEGEVFDLVVNMIRTKDAPEPY
jgi:phage terminase small subunit